MKRKEIECDKEDNKIQKETEIKFIDLFCGIGGFHLGMKKFNSKCVWACDIDKHCRNVYHDNFDVKPFEDICNSKTEDIPNHDILFAGFPCQPFSISGKMKCFSDKRTDSYVHILRILKEKNTNCFILENVKTVSSLFKGDILKKIIKDMEELKYQVSWCVLNAYNFGIPQNRERLFIVGSKKQKFDTTLLKNIRFHGLLDGLLINKPDYIKEDKYTLLDSDKIKKQEKSGLMFCGYINGGLRKDIIENKITSSGSHSLTHRIYDITGSCPTLRSSDRSCRYYIRDSNGVMKLSFDDLYPIMGFPKDFKKHVIKTISIKQISNAVCPFIVEKIVECMISQNMF